MSENLIHVDLFVAVLALFGVLITAGVSLLTAILQHRTKKDVAEINDAVNHRHEKRGDGALKLYDLVWENHQKADELIDWKRSYEGGPMDNGAKVVEFVETITERIEKLENGEQCNHST